MIKDEGNPHNITTKYLDNIMNKGVKNLEKRKDENNKEKNVKKNNIEISENRTGNFNIMVENIKILDFKTRKVKKIFNSEDGMIIKIDYKRNKTEIKELVAGFAIYRVDGVHCYGTNSFIDNLEQIKLKDKGSIEIYIERLQLIPSEYFIDVAFHNEYGVPYDDILKAERISVYSNIKDQGIFRINHKFKHV